jgi:flagellar biosynthesis activator protein FlaF
MATSFAQGGYEASTKTINSDSGMEYQVFARVTRDLSNIRTGAPDYHAKKAAALNKNMKLWSILAVEVANENNKLPPQLRSNIFQLAEFTRHHTSKIYAGEGELRILIEVNTMIMRGLRTQPPTETPD